MKYYNIHNEEIPISIVHIAEKLGCHSVHFIYNVNKNYGKPVANLNIIDRPRPFENDDNARRHKVSLGIVDDIEWVVFESPKGKQ